MNALRKPLLIAAVVAIVGGLGFEYLRLLRPAQAREVRAACNGLRSAPGNKTLGMLPVRAPDFSAQDHTGKMVQLSDFRGKVVVLRFWGSWCTTCGAEQGSLEDLAADMADDVVVIAPSADVEWAPISAKLKNGSNTLVVLDPPDEAAVGPIGEAYGVGKVPETFIIDREGIVRFYLINKRDWTSSVSRTCLRSLVNE